MTSHKSVPSNEPLEAIYPHRVTFQKAGWFHFAYCACGWIDCDSDQGMLTIKACCHGIIPGSQPAGEGRACPRCNGTGWLEAIGPKSDGSYITSRPCPCGAYKGLEP